LLPPYLVRIIVAVKLFRSILTVAQFGRLTLEIQLWRRFMMPSDCGCLDVPMLAEANWGAQSGANLRGIFQWVCLQR
jgi:hypothetical protein